MNNDLISRSALIDTFCDTVFFDEDSKCKALELIENAPTVEEKSYAMGYQDGLDGIIPQGEWIVCVDEDNIQTCKCSICGRIVDIANREFDKFPYCHCGAKMKGGGV